MPLLYTENEARYGSRIVPGLVLEIVEGPQAGEKRPLTGPVLIGRDPGAGLVLDDELVSRHHVRIAPQNAASAVVEDLGSRNGTFVNGSEAHGTVRLEAGDQVLVGVTLLELRAAEDLVERPTAVRPKPAGLARPLEIPDYIPPAVTSGVPTERRHRLDPLLDVRSKARARTAPLAMVVLVSAAVALYVLFR